jgi:hypothetical protein
MRIFMDKSENIAELAAALVLAQADFGKVKFDKTVAGRYKYASLVAILDTVKQALNSKGISILQNVSGNDGAVTVTTTLLHASGQFITSEPFTAAVHVNKGMTPTQAIGATVTYLKRYSLAAMLSVAADEDTDASRPIETNEAAEVSQFSYFTDAISAAPSHAALNAFLERNKSELEKLPENEKIELRKLVIARRNKMAQ